MDIPDESPLPVDRALENERREQLRQGMVLLSPQQRQCVELRLEDLKYHEIAAIMGLSIETIKSHLHQARQALKTVLRDSEQKRAER